MEIFWLQQCEADVPAADDWLSESEAVRLNSFRIAKRRTDWRLGRWTAKCAVAASLKLPDGPGSLKRIEISQASTGEPEVSLVDRAKAITISISHSHGIAICAVATGNVKLGCDLEVVETRSDAFISDYFTREEQALIAQTSSEKRSALVTLLWSAKESTLKALHTGLRDDTRNVRVETLDPQIHWFGTTDTRAPGGGGPTELSDVSCNDWYSLRVYCADGHDLRGWWQRTGNFVRTVVAAPPPATPVALRFPVSKDRHLDALNSRDSNPNSEADEHTCSDHVTNDNLLKSR